MQRYYPYWHHSMQVLGRERGWPEPSPDQFAQEVRHGALHLGSPETVARKVANTIQTLGATRFGMKYGNGRFAPRVHDGIHRTLWHQGQPMVLEMLAE